jgi:hypothetical protein
VDFQEPYRVLGVEPSSNFEEIKSAFRYLSKKYHPDRSNRRDSSERLVRVIRAYKSLETVSRKDTLVHTPLRPLGHPKVKMAKPRVSMFGAPKEGDLFFLGQIALTAPDPHSRRQAVRKLGFSGKKAAYIFLRRALSDSDESVVSATVRSIADLSVYQAAGELAALWARGSESLRRSMLEIAQATGEPVFKSALELASREGEPWNSRAQRLLAVCRNS